MSKNLRRFYFYRMLSFVMYASPLVVLFCVNYSAYVKPQNALSFWGYLIALFLCLAFKTKLTLVAKKNVVLTLSVVIFVIALIMRFIAGELLLISAMSLLGCILSNIFEPVADTYKLMCYKDGIKTRLLPLPHKQAWSNAYLGVIENGQ